MLAENQLFLYTYTLIGLSHICTSSSLPHLLLQKGIGISQTIFIYILFFSFLRTLFKSHAHTPFFFDKIGGEL